MIKRILSLSLSLLLCPMIFAQAPNKPTSADIQAQIKKLNFLGSVLYVAAHPDDENTTLISYMSNHVHAETAYMSLTRGDGGQNLIGTEIQDLLGVLRTEELLAARKIDGGKQFFSRANDFGFSKHPDETFEIWNKDEVLSDLVLTIRKFQPDIIINRFDHRTAGTTHGHHTGSAVLSYEAFELAGKQNAYPNQMFPAYQAKRQFFNTSWWFYGSQENFEKADKTNLFSAEVGVFFPLKGKSNTEIAAESRSQHRCQGMGRIGSRGESTEYLEWLQGSKPTAKDDVFSGINTTWGRLKGGENIGALIAQIDQEFESTAPYKSVDKLLEVYKMISALEPSIWKERKLAECRDIIIGCSGMYVDCYTSEAYGTPGSTLSVDFELINRSPLDWKLISASSSTIALDSTFNQDLAFNKEFSFEENFQIPEDSDYSSAYWLRKEGTIGMYRVDNEALRGRPESPDPIHVLFNLELDGITIPIERPVVYKMGDPVKGEVYDPFEILPVIFISPVDESIICRPGEKRQIKIELLAGEDNVQGVLRPNTGKNWKVTPTELNFTLESKGQKSIFVFELEAPITQSVENLSFTAEVQGKTYSDRLFKIEYDHIPTQLILKENKMNTICIDLKFAGSKVAYIMGAGDKIPEALQTIGYQVDIIPESDITVENLKKYPSVIVGIRAYNTIDDMKFHHKVLMEYVHQGGTLVTQYNTSRGIKADNVGPYPMELSRDRVTDEFAKVTILKPDHEVMNFPNKITDADFDGWIQERGLYFPDKWDEQYTPILSSHDKGEEPLDGGLLVAEYGNGHFVYTGYSFFRELPAGVPGAYRLFANLISLGQQNKP